MKRYVSASADAVEKKSYKVYYSDGNQRMFDAPNIVELMKYLSQADAEYSTEIYKIEEAR